MPMPNRSRFTFDTEDLTLEIAARPWSPSTRTVGSKRISGAGVPASYVARTDRRIALTLRFLEEEMEDVRALVDYGMTAQTFLWFPDATAVDSYLVYLDEPAAGEDWEPIRDGQFQRMFETTLILRGVGVVIPWQRYFPADT